MAVFIVGMVCGNMEICKFHAIGEENYDLHLKFKEVLVSILRIMIFVLLRVQMNFNILSKYWGKALILVVIFVFIARPVSAFLSVIFDRKANWNLREIVYLMWTKVANTVSKYI